MNPKFSHLIRAGAIVHSVDGNVYRCTSKLASNGAVLCRFADLQGKPVTPPANFRPISSTLVRFAAWMRYVVAYNKDFDLYVKEYIKAAGLPVDEAMDWSKWFAAKIAPKLNTRDEEEKDEAIHHIIVKTLAERNVLEKFPEAIKKFKQERQDEPIERQVTTFLISNFMWRIEEANNYIRKFIHQEHTDSMWSTEDGEDEGKDINRLDTEEFANSGQYDDAEADIEMDRFRRGFSDYLHNKFGELEAEQYLTLFDIIYEEIKANEDSPTPADVEPIWMGEMRKSKNDNPEASQFKKRFYHLPKLIDRYIELKHNNEEDLHPFLEIMRSIGQKNKHLERQKNMVHASFGGLKLAEEAHPPVMPPRSNAYADQYDHAFPKKEKKADDEQEDKDQGISFNMPAAITTMGDVAGGLEELAPLAALASKEAAGQWKTPTCTLCGTSKETRDCPACKSKYCGECILNHHANNPSHDRIASVRDVVSSWLNGVN